MGCGSSAEDHDLDREVQKDLTASQRQDAVVHKLLLLGAGGSGKSTFFKQLRLIHGGGHTKREKEGYRRQVFGQMNENMRVLVQQCRMIQDRGDKPLSAIGGEDDYATDEDDEDEALSGALRESISPDDIIKLKIEEDLSSSAKYMIELTATSQMSRDTAAHLKALWTQSDAIQLMFTHRNKICVPDTTAYFYDNVERISAPDYLPSDEDVLRVRWRTTGMTEKEFDINGAKFRVHDVGGQRNERKKWIHFFDSVTAVLFVISLSCYDEVPFEDVTDLDADLRSANNMIESVNVFTEVLKEPSFDKVGFILFLNKADLMAEKIKRVPITTAFPEYTGSQEFAPSVEYIRKVFMSKNTLDSREMFAHVTTATDTENVTRLFNNVQEMVVNWSLKAAGLV